DYYCGAWDSSLSSNYIF
nr:immunoglobulin light chain junction region [Macaca mulatta]MOX34016.1 immunoglobulin light chain junction region [Macaca mulatta]MOX34658.1 immunoglobulin light chain junction region [Macaca mulatta]MOX35223.1 immunoglobulin light chain junction region [Macaca mulatta]MOX35500.1 immunoglobulin light chain junction region [Macaca mulatta]